MSATTRRLAHLGAALMVAMLALLGCSSSSTSTSTSTNGKILDGDDLVTWEPDEQPPPGDLGSRYEVRIGAAPSWLTDIGDQVQHVVMVSNDDIPIYWFSTETRVVYHPSAGKPCGEIMENVRDSLSDGTSTHPSPPPVPTDEGDPWDFECRRGDAPPLGQL